MSKCPAKPCRYPGCPQLTHERYCSVHAKVETARYRKYQRDPKINRHYDKAWKQVRKRYLAAHPLCEDCQKAGRVTPAAEVHHIQPLSKGGTHDESNLRALCKPCYSRQSAVDGDRWRQAPRVYTH